MKKLLSACAIAATFVVTPASAQWYVGGGVGSSKISGADGTIAPLTLTGANSNKTSAKIYGGYQITPTWGVEAQYTDLGNRDFVVRNAAGTTLATGSLKASQYSIAGTGTLPLSANFALMGKLGVSSNRLKARLLGVSDAGSDTSAMAGIGIRYNITPALAVRLEYEDFGNLSKNGGVNDTDIRGNNVSINLQYAF